MTLRHKTTGQEAEGNFKLQMGWYQLECAGHFVSYPASEWEEVVDEAPSQS